MKRSDLIKAVKCKFNYYAYRSITNNVCIADQSVLKIIKFIEKNYHEQLFKSPQKKK